MRDRFIKLCPEKGSKVHFGTFHSVFYKIVRAFGKKYRIASEREKEKILGLISKDRGEAKDLSDRISRYKSGTGLELVEPKEENRPEFIRKLDLYNAMLRQNDLLDFDDILMECRDLLLKEPSVKRTVSSRFTHILVDEFQDSSTIQYEILKLISSGMDIKNIFAVGDENQSVYNFRGARFGIFNDFLNDFEKTGVYRLNINYRNEESILRAADKVMGICENNECRLVTGTGFDMRIFKSKHEEQTELAEMIVRSVAEGKSTCVLSRTNKDLEIYKALYEKTMGKKEDPGTKSGRYIDIIALTADIIDFISGNKRSALLKILPFLDPYIPRTYFTEEDIDLTKVSEKVGDNGIKQRIRDLSRHLRILSAREPESFVLYLKNVLFKEKGLWKSEEMEASFIIILSAACRSKSLSELYSFLQDSLSESSLKEERKGPVIENPAFLTFHASKGLEFDHVFIPDVTEGHIPRRSAFSETNEEEEKRLLYVAMTRAKEKLFLYTIKSEGNNSVLPSEFLKPLL